MNLQNKVAAVTGGSNGIGAAAVRMLAAEGATVVVGYGKSRERAEAVIKSLPPGKHSTFALQLEDSASVKHAGQVIADTHGRCDILINSAGFTKPVPHANLDALDDDLIDLVLRANARGPFAMIRALAPLLKASGDGVIVNVSSISAFTGSGSSIAYCMAKAALDTMTLSLARVLGPEIRVLGVSPAAVATDFVAGRGRPELEKIAANMPLRKVTEPEDVARAIMACVTHLRSSTGTQIVVDGGRHLV